MRQVELMSCSLLVRVEKCVWRVYTRKIYHYLNFETLFLYDQHNGRKSSKNRKKETKVEEDVHREDDWNGWNFWTSFLQNPHLRMNRSMLSLANSYKCRRKSTNFSKSRLIYVENGFPVFMTYRFVLFLF